MEEVFIKVGDGVDETLEGRLIYQCVYSELLSAYFQN